MELISQVLQVPEDLVGNDELFLEMSLEPLDSAFKNILGVEADMVKIVLVPMKAPS